MFEAVFSFRGRLARLQYFLGVLALTAGIIVALLLIGAAMFASGLRSAPPMGLVILLVLVVAPLFCWISFSLQARRFRDIGWDPLFVIPGWIGVMIVDRLAAGAAPTMSVGGLRSETWLGFLINLALAGALLFWPSRADDDSLLAELARWAPSDEPSSSMPTPAPTSMATPAAPVRAAQPAASFGRAAPAATGFGRRGL